MAAEGFSQFLLPMLHPDPARRATAAQCLKHPWITNTDFITRVSFRAFLRNSHFTIVQGIDNTNLDDVDYPSSDGDDHAAEMEKYARDFLSKDQVATEFDSVSDSNNGEESEYV